MKTVQSIFEATFGIRTKIGREYYSQKIRPYQVFKDHFNENKKPPVSKLKYQIPNLYKDFDQKHVFSKSSPICKPVVWKVI